MHMRLPPDDRVQEGRFSFDKRHGPLWEDDRPDRSLLTSTLRLRHSRRCLSFPSLDVFLRNRLNSANRVKARLIYAQLTFGECIRTASPKSSVVARSRGPASFVGPGEATAKTLRKTVGRAGTGSSEVMAGHKVCLRDSVSSRPKRRPGRDLAGGESKMEKPRRCRRPNFRDCQRERGKMETADRLLEPSRVRSRRRNEWTGSEGRKAEPEKGKPDAAFSKRHNV